MENYGIKFVRITNDKLLGNPNKAFEKIENEINVIKAGLHKKEKHKPEKTSPLYLYFKTTFIFIDSGMNHRSAKSAGPFLWPGSQIGSVCPLS